MRSPVIHKKNCCLIAIIIPSRVGRWLINFQRKLSISQPYSVSQLGQCGYDAIFNAYPIDMCM